MSESSNISNKKYKKIMIIMSIIIFIVFGILDRLSKIYALYTLKDHPSIAIIPGVIEFHYLENDGAAFGLLKGQKAFFIFVAIIIISAIAYILIKMPAKRKYIPASVFITFIATGAMENMTDRIIYNNVIDFIYISSVKFPIFNVADIYVTLASILLIFFVLFVYKEEDLNFLRFKEKKLREI